MLQKMVCLLTTLAHNIRHNLDVVPDHTAFFKFWFTLLYSSASVSVNNWCKSISV